MSFSSRPNHLCYSSFDSSSEPYEIEQFWATSSNSEQPQQQRYDERGPDDRRHQSHLMFSLEEDPARGSTGGLGHYLPTLPPNPFTRVPARKPLSSPYLKTLSTVKICASSTSRPRTDPEVDSLIEMRAGQVAPWGIHWWPIVGMVGLFILGVIGAISHHAFYQSLDGQHATDQLTKIRYGTALAFFTKMTLVGSVVIAYRQRIWYTLRRRAMTLGAIDGLFAAVEDPLVFCNWEMIKNAKLASLMALATWLIPIAAVLSPASLTTHISNLTNSTVCPLAASLNFSAESYNNFRNPKDVSGYPEISLCYFNTTDPKGTQLGYFDYFDQPSKDVNRLGTMCAYSNKVIDRQDGALRTCGAGWNCTYSISFTGPGYKCTELASGIDSNTTELHRIGAPFNTSSLVPVGINIYQAVIDIGEYADPQVPSANGIPIHKPWPTDLGVFKTEPVLWIGHTVDTGEKLPPGSPYSQWETVQIPKIFSCVHHETQYTVLFNYTEGQQQATVTNRTFLAPIIDNTVGQFPNGTLNPNISFPTSAWVRPNTDVHQYKLTAAYHSLSLVFRSWLRGTIEHTHTKWPITKSDISVTRLVDQRTFYPVPDFQTQLQSFYEDIILTLISNPRLIIGSTESVPCTKSRRVSVFSYRGRDLWAGYAIVIAVTVAFLVVGLMTLLENGVASDTGFSRIMVTTRNPTLDRLSVGACLGGDPFPAELKKTKLMFGVLDPGSGDDAWSGVDGAGHCAFGTEAQTGMIIKGRRYAGLGGDRENIQS